MRGGPPWEHPGITWGLTTEAGQAGTIGGVSGLCLADWLLAGFSSGMLEYEPAKRFSIRQIRQHR